MKNIQDKIVYKHSYEEVLNACKTAISYFNYNTIEARANYLYARKNHILKWFDYNITVFLMKRGDMQTEVCIILEYRLLLFIPPKNIVRNIFNNISSVLTCARISDKSNKRKHMRIPAILMCDLFTSGTDLLEGRVCIINYSLGGVAFETKLDIPIETEVLLLLKDDAKELEIHGILMHTKKTMEDVYVYGMRFQNLNVFKRCKIQKTLGRWRKSLSEQP